VAERVVAQGRVLFEPATPGFEGADLRLQLEDVSRADAASRVVARLIVPGVSRSEGADNPIEFALRTDAVLQKTASYVMRAHVDVDRSGGVNRGDFVSTQSYPIDQAQLPATLDILVKLVR